METFVAKTLQGLEEVLANELKQIGAQNITTARRAVTFEGTLETLYKANVHSRTALRILRPIATFKASSTDELYSHVKAMHWDAYMDVTQTFLIETTLYSPVITNSRFATYKVKDAIADYFNEKYGKRPSISVTKPDIYLNLHISDTTCTLSLDSSGEPLFKRGYRVAQTEAPINEVLAAGMLLLAGWKGQSDFMDPMCGSGTIAIEAALIALNIPPGIFRSSFAFENWKDFDADLFDAIYNDDSHEREFKHTIYASDISRKALAVAEANAKNAGLSKYIQFTACSFEEVPEQSKPLLMVTNPPYGERLNRDDVNALYSMIGSTLKHKFAGSTAWIISSNIDAFDKVGLKPDAKIHLINGSLPCDFRKYTLFSGKHKEFKSQKSKVVGTHGSCVRGSKSKVASKRVQNKFIWNAEREQLHERSE
ncbi:MAG: THUMP domain-containing protein [Paludibacteraceae bacterium]|nr:THUMP domain-containing protein [Paludibacteraceae bacterium]